MWNQIKRGQELQDRCGFGRTENDALTHNSSGSYVLDLFFKVPAMRGASIAEIHRLFRMAWGDNQDLTVRTMLWARDARGGAGERRIFREFLYWLYVNNQIEILKRVIRRVPDLGRWDDLFVIPPHLWIGMYVEALKDGNSLAAKWAPREKSKKWPALYRAFCNALGMTPKQYRKFIAGLTRVVEQDMSANRWAKINYEHVPSIAGIRYRNAFMRHDEQRYREFLEKVRQGKAKINISVAFPYQVIHKLIQLEYRNRNRGYSLTVDQKELEAILTQWGALPNYLENADGFILPMIDVSGSMIWNQIYGELTPLDVAVSMGLYIADKQKPPWNDIVLTFSRNPRLLHVPGNIHEKIKEIFQGVIGVNTDLVRAFRAVLDYGVRNGLRHEEMPKYIIVFSDMEFDKPDIGGGNFLTNYEAIKILYNSAGYRMPILVFWNMQARNQGNIPVRALQDGVILVAGFSPKIAEMILGMNEEKINPFNLFIETISNPRYDY